MRTLNIGGVEYDIDHPCPLCVNKADYWCKKCKYIMCCDCCSKIFDEEHTWTEKLNVAYKAHVDSCYESCANNMDDTAMSAMHTVWKSKSCPACKSEDRFVKMSRDDRVSLK